MYENILKNINKYAHYDCREFGTMYRKNFPIVYNDYKNISDSENLLYNLYRDININLWYRTDKYKRDIVTDLYKRGFLFSNFPIFLPNGFNLKIIYSDNEFFKIKKNKLIATNMFYRYNNVIREPRYREEALLYFRSFTKKIKRVNIEFLDSIINNINKIDNNFSNYIVELDSNFNANIHYNFLKHRDHIVSLKNYLNRI